MFIFFRYILRTVYWSGGGLFGVDIKAGSEYARGSGVGAGTTPHIAGKRPAYRKCQPFLVLCMLHGEGLKWTSL